MGVFTNSLCAEPGCIAVCMGCSGTHLKTTSLFAIVLLTCEHEPCWLPEVGGLGPIPLGGSCEGWDARCVSKLLPQRV